MGRLEGERDGDHQREPVLNRVASGMRVQDRRRSRRALRNRQVRHSPRARRNRLLRLKRDGVERRLDCVARRGLRRDQRPLGRPLRSIVRDGEARLVRAHRVPDDGHRDDIPRGQGGGRLRPLHRHAQDPFNQHPESRMAGRIHAGQVSGRSGQERNIPHGSHNHQRRRWDRQDDNHPHSRAGPRIHRMLRRALRVRRKGRRPSPRGDWAQRVHDPLDARVDGRVVPPGEPSRRDGHRGRGVDGPVVSPLRDHEAGPGAACPRRRPGAAPASRSRLALPRRNRRDEERRHNTRHLPPQ